MRLRYRRRSLAATVLALTVVVVVVVHRGDPTGPAAPPSGHQHGGGPDPVTAAVLALNVVVLLGLAVLARSWPAGLRRTDATRSTWHYREPDRDVRAGDRPAAEQVHPPADLSTNSHRSK